MVDAAVVFVHGLFSSQDTWHPIRRLLEVDPELSGLPVLYFGYESPKFVLNPLRRIPSYDTLADSLQTFLEVDAKKYDKLVIVSHSQGGLIVQRFLARMVTGGRGAELQRIKRVVMFACPNSGSEIFLIARRGLWARRHPQERELRPINESVTEAHKVVINRIVHAQSVASDCCPITIRAYAGDTDNIVTPTSARSVFPNTGVIPGDHFTIIRPDSHSHRTYTTLKDNLLAALAVEAATHPLPNTDAQKEAKSEKGEAPSGIGWETDLAPLGEGFEGQDGSQPPAAPTGPDVPVVVRYNPRTRTVDFIVSPETALTWVRKLGEEGDPNDQ
ncbi:alpha/beta fold hydrolase [Streptomyces sp. NPDC006314]|uniref:esterase/lipase family protein n=1 Tax=Streptomyces sp. NPDC006314 TaxID=3154475 RepID=UPI0033B4546A